MTPLQNYLEETDNLFEEKFNFDVIFDCCDEVEKYRSDVKNFIKSFLHQRQVGLVELVKDIMPKEKIYTNKVIEYGGKEMILPDLIDKDFVDGFNSYREQFLKNLEK